MRTFNQLALLLSKLASHRAEKLLAARPGGPLPPSSRLGFAPARNVMFFSLPDEVPTAPDVKPEDSYLALFISMLIKCQSPRGKKEKNPAVSSAPEVMGTVYCLTSMLCWLG